MISQYTKWAQHWVQTVGKQTVMNITCRLPLQVCPERTHFLGAILCIMFIVFANVDAEFLLLHISNNPSNLTMFLNNWTYAGAYKISQSSKIKSHSNNIIFLLIELQCHANHKIYSAAVHGVPSRTVPCWSSSCACWMGGWVRRETVKVPDS